nr:MAG TPA: hypothetical protein [Caudoviricetes sp.]
MYVIQVKRLWNMHVFVLRTMAYHILLIENWLKNLYTAERQLEMTFIS